MDTYKHGGDIYRKPVKIDFSANINCFGMPESVKQAAIQGITEAVNYPDPQCEKLKQAILQMQAEQGLLLEEEDLICANGASELIYALVQVLRPGKALLLSPGFHEYESALGGVDCEIRFYELQRQKGYQLTREFLKVLLPDLDLLILCNPNNPTGRLIEPDLTQMIIQHCKEKHIFLIMDECFLDFTEQEPDYSVKPYIQHNPQIFLLKAFTKLYAMPGLRLGYGICKNPTLMENIKSKIQPWSVSTPAQLAGIAACGETAYVRDSLKGINQEKQRMYQRLVQLGFEVYPGAANYLFFQGKKGLWEYCMNRGILIRDCSNYRNLEEGAYRIVIRQEPENHQLLQVLTDFINESGQEKQEGIQGTWQR